MSFGPDRSKRSCAWGSCEPVLATNTFPRADEFEFWQDESLPVPPIRVQKGFKPQPKLASSLARPKPRPATVPPKAGAWMKNGGRFQGGTLFKRMYDRGDIPVHIGHGARRRLEWKCDIKSLDYHHFLPLFFEGLREIKEPFCFVAYQGALELLGNGGQEQILPVIPQLVLPMKRALSTKNRDVIVRVLLILQSLAKSGRHVGKALVPYYRQLLPTFNLILTLDSKKNLGDRIDFAQRKKGNLQDLVHETLGVLERKGGRDARVNIQYMIPTFDSVR